MINKAQFEALVRAAAAAKYPLAHHDPANGPIDFSVNDRQRNLREAYIAARMENEWPLVQQCRAVLPPYTTKPA